MRHNGYTSVTFVRLVCEIRVPHFKIRS